jgi:dTDP-4-amino-4,6-dideoxygalactose transaminase
MAITVTQPYLPPLDEFTPFLQKIWENKWLTNGGPFHQQLEKELTDYLGIPYISVFANGTLALLTALQALDIQGEVITTPFSFVATAHSLLWNGIKPVFVDIEPDTFNLDPQKIEAAITPQTTAIMPVHVYGNPCNHDAIKAIADKHHLKLIYDAAHTFGVKQKGVSIANYGDLSILSFHATKVYNTFEGGAIVCHTREMKQRIDDLKNFGFRDEVTVIAPGINAKMNEIQAAFGILQLKYIDQLIAKRKVIAETYRSALRGIAGIRILEDSDSVTHNYSYFPIIINDDYGMSRDEIYDFFKANEIYARRYFYPLISQFPMYNNLESAKPENLAIAENISKRVLCLPIYPDLELSDVVKIITILKKQ